MAKFAIVMPATGGIIPMETIVEADEIFIHHDLGISVLRINLNEVAIIPKEALVYRVAEKKSEPVNIDDLGKEWKNWLDQNGVIKGMDQNDISQLKKRISTLSEVVAMKDKANTELDSLLNDKDETIEMQADQIKFMSREIEALKCELKEEKDRAVKFVKVFSESLKNSFSE